MMNQERFLELLNLYLDEELDSVGIEELFDSIKNNENYRQHYLEYCMLNQACSQLPKDFPSKRSRLGVSQMVYAFGGMAAALALVFIGIQNTIPLLDNGMSDDLVSPGFAVDASAADVFVMKELREPNLNLATVSVGLDDSNLAFSSNLKSNDQSTPLSSWKSGLIERTGEGSSLDHELQLVFDRSEYEFVLREEHSSSAFDTSHYSGLELPKDSLLRPSNIERSIPAGFRTVSTSLR